MPTSQQIADAIATVKDRDTLLQGLLADTLNWPGLDKVERLEDFAYPWTDDELRTHNLNAQIWQLPLQTRQAWGIFIVEFAQAKVSRTALRQVLRGLVPNRRGNPALPAWDHENLLFICTTRNHANFSFAHFRGDKAQSARLATFGWQQSDRRLRTLCEFNLPALEWPEDNGKDEAAWLKDWAKAFDKEPLTKDFFKRFDKVVDAVKADLMKHQSLESADAYSRAQLLIERLVFLYFLQNRGWLDQKRDYLLDGFKPHRAKPKEFSYYGDFVEKLFWSLATHPTQGGRFNGIPFLNGGLFDDDEFAPNDRRKKHHPPLLVTNATFALVFDELLEAFNFTVREDTPLDQDVAVDPEMLGKVFESIVLHAEAADPEAVAPDKRKATGSYYTPRIVVHFICREVLVQYLIRHFDAALGEPGASATGVEQTPKIRETPIATPVADAPGSPNARIRELFKLDASHALNPADLAKLKTLLSPQEGKALRDTLKKLTCCDPAVGSGAFPLGLLHELVVLRRIVETAANGYVDPIRKEGANWLHDVKEEIVRDCLFGVDPFAADVQQFRAAIEKISQLPNLEMNFHRGDSLLDMISDEPVRIEPGVLTFHRPAVKEIQELGRKLHKTTKGEKKKELRVEILRKRLDLTEAILNETLQKLVGKVSKLTSVLFGVEESASVKRKLNRALTQPYSLPRW